MLLRVRRRRQRGHLVRHAKIRRSDLGRPLIACELLLPSPLPGLRCLPIGSDRNGFSREELRDIVTITALHLTLREKLGGLIDTAGGFC